MMDPVNQRVFHKRFGFGHILQREGGTIRVAFEESGERSFVYPESFDRFLTACDPDFARQAADDLRGALDGKAMEEKARLDAFLEGQRAQTAAKTTRKTAAKPAAKKTTKKAAEKT